VEEVMKLLIFVVSTLVLCASASNAQSPAQPESHPFSISSLNTPFAVQADFEGEYRVYPDRIELKLKKKEILVRDNCKYRGRRLLTGARISLAETTETSWKLDIQGSIAPLQHEMRPGDKWSLGETTFQIPLHSAIELPLHWLVLQIEEISLDAGDVPEGESKTGYSFAHSPRDVFAQIKSN
jgi:hypothetical protein